MTYVCNTWDPTEDDKEPCNSFEVEDTRTVTVDRECDYIDSGDGEYGDLLGCSYHGDVAQDEVAPVTFYRRQAAEHNCGFCDDCFQATYPDDDWVCSGCDWVYPPGEEGHEQWDDDEEDEDEDDEPAPRHPIPDHVHLPGRGYVRMPRSTIHAASL